MLLYLTNWYIVTIYTCTCIRPVKYPKAESLRLHGHHLGRKMWEIGLILFEILIKIKKLLLILFNDIVHIYWIITLSWMTLYISIELSHFPEWLAIFFQKSVLSKKKVHSYTSIPPFFLIKFLQLMLCVYKSLHCLINSYNKTSVIYRLPAVTTMWSWL